MRRIGGFRGRRRRSNFRTCSMCSATNGTCMAWKERKFQPPTSNLQSKRQVSRKKGIKLGVNEGERRQEAEKAGEYWGQATAAGLRGDRRNQWVMGRLGWDPRTDDRKLRRLMEGGR